jgi:hypothetical protein
VTVVPVEMVVVAMPAGLAVPATTVMPAALPATTVMPAALPAATVMPAAVPTATVMPAAVPAATATAMLVLRVHRRVRQRGQQDEKAADDHDRPPSNEAAT